LLSTVALFVALSGGPDYAAIAQRPVTTPVTAPVAAPAAAPNPAASTPASPPRVLTSNGDNAVVADVVLAPLDERLAPALDWYVWDRLAECESGGQWNRQGSLYGGGLQILTSTWRNFGGLEFAAYPGQATREQQIVVGRAIEEAGGWRQWPACAKRIGLR
jgi:hypothetical protein